jgi:hypothetical protein
VDGDDHSVSMGKQSYRHVGPLGLGDRAFDNDMVNRPVIVSTMSLGIKIYIGASGNCQDCAMGGENVDLLRTFLDLWWGLGWWIAFCFDLGVGVVWHVSNQVVCSLV